MAANHKAVNSYKQTLIKLLETFDTECLRVELAKKQVASIHRAAEKEGILGNWYTLLRLALR